MLSIMMTKFDDVDVYDGDEDGDDDDNVEPASPRRGSLLPVVPASACHHLSQSKI